MPASILNLIKQIRATDGTSVAELANGVYGSSVRTPERK